MDPVTEPLRQPHLPAPIGKPDAAGAFNFLSAAIGFLTGAAFSQGGTNPLFSLAVLPLIGNLLKGEHKE